MRTGARLRADVLELAGDDGRLIGSAGHERAAELLYDRLRRLGTEPYRDDTYRLGYQAGDMSGANLVGVVPGRDRSAPPMLLGAHYDSVIAAPCADDNAAAVAIVLEVGYRLSGDAPPARDVVLALFDAEEPPHTGTPAMGSIHFVANQMDSRGVHCAIIQDLTGHAVSVPVGGKPRLLPRIRNLLFMTGAESHAALAGVVESCPLPRRLPLIATLNSNVGDVSDHLPFRRHGMPYLFFSCGRWQHYHQPTDTPDRLDYGKMRRIAVLLTTLTQHLAASDFAVAAPPFAGAASPATVPAAGDGDGAGAGRGADTTAFELRCLRRALGPWLPVLRRHVSLPQIATRDDLDQLAARLIAGGL